MRNHASNAMRHELRRSACIAAATITVLLPPATEGASGGWPADIESRITRAIDGSGVRVNWKSKVECTETICEAELTGADPNPTTVDWMTELTQRLPLTEWGVKQLSMVIREKSPGVRVSVLRLSNETLPQTTVVSDP